MNRFKHVHFEKLRELYNAWKNVSKNPSETNPKITVWKHLITQQKMNTIQICYSIMYKIRQFIFLNYYYNIVLKSEKYFDIQSAKNLLDTDVE